MHRSAQHHLPDRHTRDVLGVAIDAISAEQAVARISHWAQQRQSRCVYFCNVHSVVTASTDPGFRQVLNQADIAAPDGAPVAWMVRQLGQTAQRRVCGPDLMAAYCAHAADHGESVFLLGSTEETLARLAHRLHTRWPKLHIAGWHSPPFRPLSSAEDEALVARINASGANTVWVGLGCPKQELWMAAHRGQVQAVMLGVGAAFDFHAGTVARAPAWMQQNGLEWLYRLGTEPRRLFGRYAVTNTRFLFGAAKQLLAHRRRGA